MVEAATGADDQGRGFPLRKRLRAHIDAVVGRAVAGEIDGRTVTARLSGNRDETRRGIGLAGAELLGGDWFSFFEGTCPPMLLNPCHNPDCGHAALTR